MPLCYVVYIRLRVRAGRLRVLDMGELECGEFMSRREIVSDSVHGRRGGSWVPNVDVEGEGVFAVQAAARYVREGATG